MMNYLREWIFNRAHEVTELLVGAYYHILIYMVCGSKQFEVKNMP